MTAMYDGDVAVIGAGLIGLAIACDLSERGAIVRVFDRGEPGRAASWAAAGMLAPFSERIEDEALLALCARSLAEYPSFVERATSTSGVDSHLRLNGIVHVAFALQEMERLAEHMRELLQRGVRCRMLDRAQTLACEPWLGSHVLGSLILEDEGAVDNRRLGRALVAACEARGVTIVRDVTDLALECDSRRVLGVRSHLGFAAATSVVNAAGAWAGELAGVPAGARAPVFPVKGQMIALAVPRGLIQHTTWVPGAYLVPRDDGRLLIGATVEPGILDERITSHAVRGLLDAALRAAPALGAFTLTESWAGFRPATPDGRPLIGATRIEGYWLATGHFRNGILLAPVTAGLIADHIEGSVASAERIPFDPARFKTEAKHVARIINV